jgi:flagellar motor switch protein FliN/FliY
MKLDEGAVIRLDRPVSDPVDLVSQGVKLASGEVVVIDDCFAVRIKEMAKSK